MLGNINSYLIVIYLIAVNLIGFVSMWIDKKAARAKRFRIPELFFMMISLFSGSFGVWIAMYMFRHKIHKMKFVIGIPVILILEIYVILYLVSFKK